MHSTSTRCPSIPEHGVKQMLKQMPEQCSSNAPRNAHTDRHTYKHLTTLASYLTLGNARRGVAGFRHLTGETAGAPRGLRAVNVDA